MAQTLDETPHDETVATGTTGTTGTTRSNGVEQRVLHVPGFLDRFTALAGTAAAADGAN